MPPTPRCWPGIRALLLPRKGPFPVVHGRRRARRKEKTTRTRPPICVHGIVLRSAQEIGSLRSWPLVAIPPPFRHQFGSSVAPVWLQFDSSLAPVWLPRFARVALGTWRLWRALHSIKDGHGKRARWDPPTSDPRVRPCCPTSSYLIRSWQSHGAGSSAVPSCGMGGASISFAGWRDVAESTAPGRAGWELESGCLASSPSGPSDYGERSSSLGLE